MVELIVAKYSIPKEKKHIIVSYVENNKIKNLTQIHSSIKRVLEHDKHFDNLDDRLVLIQSFKRDSVSLDSYIARYGIEEGTRRREERSANLSKTTSKKYLIDKFGKDSYIQSRSSNKDSQVRRYGEDIGKVKWDEYLEKFSKSHSLDGYIQNYGEEHGTFLYTEKIDRAKHKNSFVGFIDRFGDDALSRWESKNEKIAYKNSKEYYIEKYGEDYYTYLRNVKDNASLNFMIEKYGEDIGKSLYKERCKKISDLAKAGQWVLHFKPENFYSKVSQLFCKDLHILLGINEDCMYGTNGGEYFIYDTANKNIRFYDFAYKNKLVEFHGDYWHKNPLFYERSEEVVRADTYKQELATARGKELYIVWEYNYYKNTASTLQDVLTFLTT